MLRIVGKSKEAVSAKNIVAKTDPWPSHKDQLGLDTDQFLEASTMYEVKDAADDPKRPVRQLGNSPSFIPSIYLDNVY